MTIRNFLYPSPKKESKPIIVEKKVYIKRSFLFEFSRVLIVLATVTAITWGITRAQTDEAPAQESIPEETTPAPQESPADEPAPEEQTPAEEPTETPSDTPTEEPQTDVPTDSTTTTSTEEESNGILGSIIDTFTDIGTGITDAISNTLNTVSDLLTSTSTLPIQEEPTASSTAPILFAEQETETGKLVTVSSPEEDPNNPHTDVLASTTIPEIYSVGEEDKIQIKWTNNGDQEMSFQAYDTDNNGKLDYVEWTIPHLSTQIFEIIFISKAFHLDTDQTILADIYDTVKEQDGTYASLSDGQYIRATFEQILNNTKDITVYAKATNPESPASIEVFPLYEDELGNLTEGPSIATFPSITEEGVYKVLLTNLNTPTDRFDLKVSGDIEVDLVIDPIAVPLFTAEADGPMNDGATFGGTSPGTEGIDFPTSTSTVDVAGFNLTVPTAMTIDTLTNSSSTSYGSVDLSASFTVTNTVTDIPFTVSGTGIVMDVNIVNTVLDNAILVNTSAEVTIAGDIDNQYGNGVNNNGTITDVSGTTTNSGGVYSIYNDSQGSILGGNFTGSEFYNSGHISGGTFIGDNFINNYDIYGGTFSGNNFINNATIYSGTFTGDSFSNSGNISGGTFTGDNFTNNSDIYGGTFSGNNFTNSGSIYGGAWARSYIQGGNTYGPYINPGFHYEISVLNLDTRLYWKNVANNSWNNTSNWFTDPEATIQADNAPWVDGVDTTYLAYNLSRAYGETSAPTIDTSIGTGVTGSSDIGGITNNSDIYGGTFTGNEFINNTSSVYDGIFTGSLFVNSNNSSISGGIFLGSDFSNTDSSSISGGTFIVDYYFDNDNSSSITGGTFTGVGFSGNPGTISGGTWALSYLENGITYGPYTNPGFPNEIAILNLYTRLYWKNISTDYSWNNTLNWFTDPEATIQAANAPWVDGVDTTYLAYNLTLANGETGSPTIDTAIGTGVTGSSDISGLNTYGSPYGSAQIYGGTFTGDNFVNPGDIFGGTFTGDNFYTNNWIGGGTFTGDNFTNNWILSGGTFTGDNFTNTDGEISSGTFSGDGFSNSSNITGGTFTGDNFTNNSDIYGGTFSGNNFTNSGTINGGSWAESYTLDTITNGPYINPGFNHQITLLNLDTRLYWKNISTDYSWNNTLNWFTDPQATIQADNAPWVDGVDTTYLAYNLSRAYGETSAPTIGVAIGTGVTGSSDISGLNTYSYPSSAQIYGGTFTGDNFVNLDEIFGGTFTGNNFTNNYNIYGGTFTGDSFTNSGLIHTGTFIGDSFINNSDIYGGTFSGDSFTNNGSISGGSWAESYTLDTITNGPYTNPGFNHQITLLNLDTSLYWKNISGDSSWNNILNWFTDPEATIQADNAPWVDGVDTTYLAYNLSRAYGETSAPTIDAAIGTGVTGSSDIGGITNNSDIYGGTFTGDNFTNGYNEVSYSGAYGTINGGTFSGNNFINGYNNSSYGNTSSSINGGTFSGNNFINGYNNSYYGYIYSSIYGGIFTGEGFSGSYDNSGDGNTYGSIYGGLFIGDGFTNSINNYIYGGTFSVDNFTNSGSISGGSWAESYTLDTITNGPYTNPGFNHQITLLNLDTSLYWKNISGDYSWNNTSNWFTDPEATIQADNAPWVDGVDTTYLAYNLFKANGGSGSPMIDTAIGTDVTGFSFINDINNSSGGTVNDGTFLGTFFYNSTDGTVNDGNFLGYSFNNYSTIYGGLFTGWDFNNYYGTIYDGTFTGGNFYNNYYSNIYDGTFTGDYFNNYYSTITGGIFTGDYFSNGYYSTITGGTFAVYGFYNDTYGSINGGTFSGDGFYNYGSITDGTWALSYSQNGIIYGPYTNPGFPNEIAMLTLDTNLYWKNISGDPSWSNPLNWFIDPEATIQATNAPWVDGVDITYLGCDLSLANGETGAPTIDVNIGTDVTGSSDIQGITNDNTIRGGTFMGAYFTNSALGAIYGGTFMGNDFYNNGEIFGGIFTGDSFVNNSTISGGSWVESYTQDTITNGPYTNPGFPHEIPLLNFDTRLYWKNAEGDNSWSNPLNWFTNPEATIPADNAPWVNGVDTTYLAYYLSKAKGETGSLSIDVPIGTDVTGYSDIQEIANDSEISGGTFMGAYFINSTYNYQTYTYGSISGGTFTGSNFNNYSDINGGTFIIYSFTNNGAIYSGIFSGDNFNNSYDNGSYGSIYNGIFSGDNFNNGSINGGQGSIYGGTFTGDNFNNGSLSGNYSYIYGGLFIGDNFINNTNSYIFGGIFIGDSFTNSGSIYGGSWVESYTLNTITNGPYTNPGFNHQITLLNFDTSLYWKNISGDYSWNNTLNWFTDPEATIQADNAPWVDGVDTTYLAYNLFKANGETGSPIIDTAIGTDVTGFSFIYNISNSSGGTVNGGNFLGAYFTNNSGGIVNDGNFLGYSFSNYYGTIYGGLFTGWDFNNYYGTIYDGTFTGGNFYNNYYSNIYGGTFTGDSFYNEYYSTITGGIFTGDYFSNGYYSTISGGIFTGDGFSSGYNNTISGGTWALSYIQDGNTYEPYTNPGGFPHEIPVVNLDLPIHNAAINSGYLDIDSCGSIISPGTYTLNTNLETNVGSCITILSSDVILDGAGMYSVTNNGINPGENAIEVLSGYTGIYIQSLDIYNTGAGAALYNYYGGTIEDMSGTIINTGSGESINSSNDYLSGKIYNYQNGTYSGLENTNITGNIINLPLADGYIWTNRIGDHNWDDAENWLPKVVPNKTTDNIILGADMILPSTISNPVYFAPGGWVLYGGSSYTVENNIYGIDGISEIGINPATNGSDITLNEVDWTGGILAGNADLSTATGGSVTITISDLDVSNKSITAGIGATNGSVTLNYNSLITDTATYLYEVGTLVLNGTQYTDTSGNSLTCTNGVSVGLGCAWNGVFNPLIFYFNNAAGDGDWNNLLNWWNDADFTVPASILPTGVDQVFIFGEIVTGINAYAGTIVFNGTSTSAIDITVSKNAIFNDESSNSGNITLSEIATFNDSSSNTGSIAAATSTFYDSSFNTGSITATTSTFYENLTSTIGGTITGFLQRIFTSSAISIRDFTTEGGRDDWTIISTGVTTVVDLSGAIYDLATNIFKGLLGGSFVENESIESGIDVVPSVTINSPIPTTTGDTTKWLPNIDWGTAVSCEYSDDNYATMNTLDCAENGADIPRPTAGEHTLHIRAIDNHGGLTEKSVEYTYDNTVPTYTMCGADLLDESTRPYYYLTANTSNTCTASVPVTLWGNASSTIPGYTLSGNYTSNNNAITFNNITTSGDVTGTPTYTNNAVNSGTVFGNTIFNTTSYNSGTILGTARFNAYTAASGVVTVSNNSDFKGTGRVSGLIKDSANNTITSWILSNGTILTGVLIGQTTFNGTSQNNGTVMSSATTTFNGDLASSTGDVLSAYVNNYSANFVALGQTGRNWYGMASTPNGDVYASVWGGDIYKQTGGVGNFVALGQTSRSWTGITSTPSGDVYAVVPGGDIYKQTGGIGNFIALGQTSRDWFGITSTPSGDVYAVVPGGDIYKQTGGIGNFIALGQTGRAWYGITSTPNGDVYASTQGGDIYKQTGGIGNFIALGQTSGTWRGITSTPNGDVYAAVLYGDIYKQTGGIGNFIALGQTSRSWVGITSTPSGDVYADVYGGDIYKLSAQGVQPQSTSTPITRIFTTAASTTRNFLTEAGRNNWIIVAQGAAVDISNAIYDTATNIFKAILDPITKIAGTFFWGSNPGGQVVPQITIATTTIPYTGNINYTASKTLKWDPHVDWDTATTCIYSYSSDFSSPISTSCSSDDTSLARPTAGDNTVYLRGTDALGNISETSRRFYYDNTSPVWTSCGADLLDESTRPYYYLATSTSNTCTATVDTKLFGNIYTTLSTVSGTGFSIGAFVGGGNDITLKNISITATSTSNGGTLTIQNATTSDVVVSGNGNGANAGSITIATSTTGILYANGANGTADGGDGGNITVTNSIGTNASSTPIFANGGSSTSCGNGGDAGLVTLTNSTYGTITANGGSANETGCPGSGKTSGQSRTVGNGITISGSYNPPGSGSTNTNTNTNTNTGGGSSTGGVLRDLIKNVVNPIIFDPLPSFSPFSPGFTPQNIGATVIPNPFIGFNMPGSLGLIKLPVNFITNVSNFLFAPLPQPITDALSSSPRLAAYIGATTLLTEQELAYLTQSPAKLETPTEDIPGLFIIKSGEQTLTAYATYDKAVGGLAQLVKVSPNQTLTISLVPQSTGEVTATYLDQTLLFSKSSRYASTYLTTPASAGRYVLKSSSSPLPLLIEVIVPTHTSEKKPWGIFNFLYNWLH